MKNLLYKEWKLAIHPTGYIFLLFGVMLLIPNYPYFVAFFYQTLAIFFTFMNGNTTNDIFFTALLPVRKRDVVKARLGAVIGLEVLQMLIAVPFAILRSQIIPTENLAGLDASLALFGLVFIMFGVFNVVFLPQFYRTGYKTGTPYLLATLVMTLVIVAAELVIQLTPALKQALDTPACTLPQIIVLFAGLLIFALLNLVAYRRSASAFERLDL
ncbi:MAG TPA: ABC-2 transporter permease [Anaerolineaceae bacterium]|nr:ABC-2 transporter permease [Anaerolineaceae bacterium]